MPGIAATTIFLYFDHSAQTQEEGLGCGGREKEKKAVFLCPLLTLCFSFSLSPSSRLPLLPSSLAPHAPGLPPAG